MSKKAKTTAEIYAGKKMLVPMLRFPEFRQRGGWNKFIVRNFFSERSEKGKIDLPLLSLTDKEGIILQSESNRKNTSNSDKSKYLVVRKGDIAYNTMRMWEGRSALATLDGLVSPAYTVCSPSDKANSKFFSFYFKTAPLIDLFHRYSQGLVKDTYNLKYDKFAALPIFSPELDEQKKIADCLSSLEELITAEVQKVEELKVHKKGLMQLLFPTEDETVPKLRFPEFHNAPGWGESKLTEFIEELRENSTIQDQYEVFTSARTGLMRQSEYYENSRLTRRDNVGFNILPPNYITYRSRSDDGLFFFNENNLGTTGIVSIYYPVFRIVGGSNKFFVNLLSRYAEVVGRKSAGNAQKVLSMNVLKEIELPVPSPEEQNKIADCLSSIDDLVTVQTQKLEALKAHKNGLLQQLFPISQMEK